MLNPKNSSSSSNKLCTQISAFKLLAPEIWFEILAKLPAKTLLKIRCVCKFWRSIIDNPDFIHFHLQLSQNPNYANNSRSLLAFGDVFYVTCQAQRLLRVSVTETLQQTSHIIIEFWLRQFYCLGSCNGLLIVCKNNVFRSEVNETRIVRLWNPSIRKSLVIPPCPFPSTFSTDWRFACQYAHVNFMDFEVPDGYPLPISFLKDCKHVFGYAPVSKVYKVVAIEAERGVDEKPRKLYLAVYTLGDQQWAVRNDGLNFSLPSNVEMSQPFYSVAAAVFLKGVAYWLGSMDSGTERHTHLGSFDFEGEEIAFSELPSSWDNSLCFLFLLRGSLAIFRISMAASSIWVLEQDNKSGTWTQRFSGKSSRDGFDKFSGLLHRRVLYCESDGGYLFCGNILYNIATCAVQKYDKDCLYLDMYSESLMLSNVYGARDLRSRSEWG